LFLGVYYNLTVWFKLTDKTHYGTLITVGGALITIAGNYILIPIAGYLGSSWVTLICYFLMTAACYLLGQRFYPIPYNVTRSLGYIVVTVAIIYVVGLVTIENQWLATSFHAAIMLAYVFTLYFLEKERFKQATN